MLARSGPLPTGDYANELKRDGFRCLVSTVGRLPSLGVLRVGGKAVRF
jgi:hypothetical protein